MNRISELRREKKLNQTGFALKFNITQYMVSAYETEKNQPSIDLLVKMADFFDVSVDYLIGRSDIRNSSNNLNENEIKCLNYFNSLNHNQKKIALAILSCLNHCDA